MADLQKTLKDVVYVAVGLGVIGFQRAQVRRQELTRQLNAQLANGSDLLQGLTRQVEERFQPVIDQLPEEAKDLVSQARQAAKEAQGQFRTLVGGAAA